jgi:hypothetical protein
MPCPLPRGRFLLRQCIQQAFVPNHPDIGYVLESYASLLLKRGHVFQAVQTYGRALKVVGIRKLTSFVWKAFRANINRAFQKKV